MKRGVPGAVGRHNVKFHCTYVKALHHRLVGDLTLAYEPLELAADPGQMILIYTAETGSPSHQALSLLASWTSTPTDRVDDEVQRQL